MNILFICDEYPPGRIGGIGTAVQSLARELVRQGHSVYVAGLYSYRFGGKNYEDDEGVKVWRLRHGLNFGTGGKGRFYDLMERMPDLMKSILNGRLAFHKFVRFIKKLVEKEKIEVIEMPDWNNFIFFSGFRVEWPAFKVPLVLKSHGSYTYFSNELNKPTRALYCEIDLKLHQRADALSAVSAYTAKKNKELFNSNRPVKVLYNAIKVAEHTSSKKRDEHKVIFTGTLVLKKGIFQLMKAWNLVQHELPGAQLYVYGKGKIEACLQYLDKKVMDTVHFKGHVARELLLQELSTATLSVFPSYSETFGIMCIEALSVGCPVIFTVRSSGPEIIQHRKNGLLVEPDRVMEISASIIELLKDASLQKQFSEKGLATVREKFNIEQSAQDHVAFYRDVISEFNAKKKSN